ncbi:unnamed protein product, partial [Arabidopsis halleri]
KKERCLNGTWCMGKHQIQRINSQQQKLLYTTKQSFCSSSINLKAFLLRFLKNFIWSKCCFERNLLFLHQ